MNKDEQKDKDDQKSQSEQLEIRTTRFKRCSLGKTVSDRFVFHQSLLGSGMTEISSRIAGHPAKLRVFRFPRLRFLPQEEHLFIQVGRT
jgi:hypothetical protein